MEDTLRYSILIIVGCVLIGAIIIWITEKIKLYCVLAHETNWNYISSQAFTKLYSYKGYYIEGRFNHIDHYYVYRLISRSQAKEYVKHSSDISAMLRGLDKIEGK